MGCGSSRAAWTLSVWVLCALGTVLGDVTASDVLLLLSPAGESYRPTVVGLGEQGRVSRRVALPGDLFTVHCPCTA